MRYLTLMLFVLTLPLFCSATDTENNLYSKTITVAADGSGDYATIGEAVKKIKGDFEEPVRIFVRKGVYPEKILINYTVNNLTIEGESADSTIISFGDYASLRNMGTSGSYTLRVDGNNVTLKNLTIENTAGNVGQAVALHTTGDRIHVVNCRILGNQDTLYASGRNSRALFDDCYVEGTVDFIFGAATALFRNCHIHAKSDSYVTAASTPADNPVGYVFHKCRITADPEVSRLHLGRTWRPYASTYFIECELPGAITAEGWHNWGNSENEKTARYGEYGCYGEGADESRRVEWRQRLSAVDARHLTDPDVIFTRKTDWQTR